MRPDEDRGSVQEGVLRGAAMGDHRIAVLPGDGVGREVAPEAVRILETVMEHTNHGFVFDEIPCGGQVWTWGGGLRLRR